MKLSVALCTYNGADYIESQLDSILNQTLPVDEIVVCDDGSTDGTMALVNKCRERSNVNINIFLNQTPLGVNGNFSKAINLCTGDVIFLADQDDIWKKNKVEKIVCWFKTHPKKEAVFTNASFIDQDSNSIFPHKDLFETVGFTGKTRFYFNHGFALEILFKNDRATGATMAIKSCLIPHLDFLKETGGYHDEKICAEAVQRRSLGYIPENLMYYRIHSAQTCGLHILQNGSHSASDSIFNPLLTNPRIGCYLYLKSAIRKFELAKSRDMALANTGKFMAPWSINAADYIRAYPLIGPVMFIRDVLSWIKRKYFEEDTISDTGYRMGFFDKI